MSSKQKFTFECLQTFISQEDYVSVNHVLQWEYQKNEIFQMVNNEGLTLIHQACLGGQFKCLDTLLRHGANAHIKSSVGWTPLHAATLGGHYEIVEYLLKECSADPLAKDDMNCLPCDLTMESSILDILKQYTEQRIIKQNQDKAAMLFVENPIRRPRSRTQTPRDSPVTLRRNRPRSMYVNEMEAEKIRNQLLKMQKAEIENKRKKKHSLYLTPTCYDDINPSEGVPPLELSKDTSSDESKDFEEIVIKLDEVKIRKARDSGVFEDDLSESGVYEGFMKEHERESQDRHFSII